MERKVNLVTHLKSVFQINICLRNTFYCTYKCLQQMWQASEFYRNTFEIFLKDCKASVKFKISYSRLYLFIYIL